MQALAKIVFVFLLFCGTRVCITSLLAQPLQPIEGVSYLVKPIDGLNSSLEDFAPSIFNGKFYFTSSREPNQLAVGENNWSRVGYSGVYQASIAFNENMPDAGRIQRLPLDFNIEDHTGPIFFSQDGKEVFLTRMDRSSSGRKTKIFYVDNTKGNKMELSKLPFQEAESNYGHASLSPDGQRLYFSSDQGGRGMNIWYSTRQGSLWSSPTAIKSINTLQSEVFPFASGDYLYFASNGHGGQGGMDLFRSKVLPDDFAPPENLGKSINTIADDHGFSLEPDANYGFFSSNREGGAGLDDIYFFRKLRSFKLTADGPEISGYFKYRELEGDNVQGTEVLLLDESGNILFSTTTDKAGFFLFKELARDKDYYVALDVQKDVDLMLSAADIVSGYFNYRKLSGNKSEGMLVALRDESGNVIFTTTDGSGRFQFRELDRDKNYSIELANMDDVDMMLSSGQDIGGFFKYNTLNGERASGIEIQLVDESGNVILTRKTDEKGGFLFRELERDKNYRVQAVDANDVDITYSGAKSLGGFYQYKTLNGDKVKGLFVQLLDEAGNVVFTTTTDANGAFLFRELDPDKNYRIQMANPEDVKLILDGSAAGEEAVLLGDRKGKFLYRKLGLDQCGTLSLIDEKNVDMALKIATLQGQLISSERLLGEVSGIELQIVDQNMKVMLRAVTKEQGYFKFEDLPLDKSYFLKTDAPLSDGMVLIFNNTGEVIAQLRMDELGVFRYKKLQLDASANLERMQLDDVTMSSFAKPTESISAKLGMPDGKIEHSYRVIVFDEDRKQLLTTRSDQDGFFQFASLPTDNSFLFKVESDDPSLRIPDRITVFNKDGATPAILVRGKDGFFMYSLLKKEVAGLTKMDDKDESELALKFNTSADTKVEQDIGQVTELPTTSGAEEEPIVNTYLEVTAAIDSVRAIPPVVQSKNPVPITAEKVPPKKTELPKEPAVGNSDVLFTGVVIYDRPKTEIKVVDKEELVIAASPVEKTPVRSTKPAAAKKDKTAGKVSNSDLMGKMEVRNDMPKVHFPLRSSIITEYSSKRLDMVIEMMRNNPALHVRVSTHADTRGPEELNMDISRQRYDSVKKYLLAKGIDASRISGQGFGASKPLNKCGENVECPDELHLQNRRAEFEFYTPK